MAQLYVSASVSVAVAVNATFGQTVPVYVKVDTPPSTPSVPMTGGALHSTRHTSAEESVALHPSLIVSRNEYVPAPDALTDVAKVLPELMVNRAVAGTATPDHEYVSVLAFTTPSYVTAPFIAAVTEVPEVNVATGAVPRSKSI